MHHRTHPKHLWGGRGGENGGAVFPSPGGVVGFCSSCRPKCVGVTSAFHHPTDRLHHRRWRNRNAFQGGGGGGGDRGGEEAPATPCATPAVEQPIGLAGEAPASVPMMPPRPFSTPSGSARGRKGKTGEAKAATAMRASASKHATTLQPTPSTRPLLPRLGERGPRRDDGLPMNRRSGGGGGGGHGAGSGGGEKGVWGDAPTTPLLLLLLPPSREKHRLDPTASSFSSFSFFWRRRRWMRSPSFSMRWRCYFPFPF